MSSVELKQMATFAPLLAPTALVVSALNVIVTIQMLFAILIKPAIIHVSIRRFTVADGQKMRPALFLISADNKK